MIFIILLQDALTQLRSMSSSGIGRMSEPIETMQSRARELEKKVCVYSLNSYEIFKSFIICLYIYGSLPNHFCVVAFRNTYIHKYT